MKWWQQALLVHIFRTLRNAGSFYLEFLLPLRGLRGLLFISKVQLVSFSPDTVHSCLCTIVIHGLPFFWFIYPIVPRLFLSWSASHSTQWTLYIKYVEQSKCPINNCFHLIEFNSEKVAPVTSSSPSTRRRMLLMGRPISSALGKQSSKHWEQR